MARAEKATLVAEVTTMIMARTFLVAVVLTKATLVAESAGIAFAQCLPY